MSAYWQWFFLKEYELILNFRFFHLECKKKLELRFVRNFWSMFMTKKLVLIVIAIDFSLPSKPKKTVFKACTI